MGESHYGGRLILEPGFRGTAYSRARLLGGGSHFGRKPILEPDVRGKVSLWGKVLPRTKLLLLGVSLWRKAHSRARLPGGFIIRGRLILQPGFRVASL
jgi:hypothetical protein